MALSHLGEHTGDLLCCTLMEEAVETAPGFQALNFPLKSYYFLRAAPPLTVHQAAAFLHPKAVQRYHSGVTPKPRPASLLPTDIWACDEPQAESPKSRAPSPTQQCFPHSAPGKYPPPFTNWFLAGANLSVSTALTAAACAMEGLQGAVPRSLGSTITAPCKG